MVDQQKPVVLLFRNTALNTVRYHSTHEARNVFELCDRPRGKAIPHAEAPGFSLRLRSMGEPYYEERRFTSEIPGQRHLLARQTLTLNIRNRPLCVKNSSAQEDAGYRSHC